MNSGSKEKINTVVISRSILDSLPSSARRIFPILEKEGNVIVKGGAVKLAVMRLLENQGSFKDSRRFEIESRINDIDLDFIIAGSAAAARQLIIKKFNRLSAAFKSSGIYFDTKDVEIIEAADWEQGVEKIIGGNDLTMNEFAMDFLNGRWRLYYTQRACRALIDGVGVLNPKPGHINYNAGRVFPSALGMIRLVKFLVAGKASRIYLPEWWRALYLENYQKKVAAGQMPTNAPLGFYSLVLLKNYFGDKPQLQKKAMVALYDLGFTDMLDPELYIRQQEQIFAAGGNRFEQTEFTIEEIIDRYLDSKRKKGEGWKVRQAERADCDHEFEVINCNLCGQDRCVIETCAKCGKNKNVSPLPCVSRMRSGYADPSGFYEIK